MLVEFAFFALGLPALVAGARMLVRGASKLALSLGVSPLVSMLRARRIGG